jgi:glycosyltransferase involved in cell wall biosynthesis
MHLKQSEDPDGGSAVMCGRKVIIANPTFYIGGTSTYSINLSQALKSAGCQTTCIVGDPFGQLYEKFQEAFDNVIILKRGMESRRVYLKKAIDLINSLQPDVIINNGVGFIQAAFPYLSRGVRMSVVHSIVASEVACGVANYEYCERIIAVSKNVANEIEKVSGLVESNILPVGTRCSVTARETTPSPQLLRLLYVGRLSRRAKNLDTLLEIARVLLQKGVRFKLSLIGDGDYLRSLKDKVSLNGLSAHVHFLGPRTQDEISYELRRHDVFLLTSVYEGTPHALLEAMDAGLVPICSLIPGATDEIIENGVSGFLCDTFSVDQYVAAIQLLAAKPNVYLSMSKAAFSTIADQYDIRMVSETILGWVNSILIQRPDRLRLSRKVNRPNICPALVKQCPGLPRHLRRLGGDFYRRWTRGLRPVVVGPGAGRS